MSTQSTHCKTAKSSSQELAPYGMREIDYIDFNYPVRIVSSPVGTPLMESSKTSASRRAQDGGKAFGISKFNRRKGSLIA